MAEQHELPLEFSTDPYTVQVDVDGRKYTICTVYDEALAASILTNLARLLKENTGVELHRPDTVWVGVQSPCDRSAMWTMRYGQRPPLA